MEFRGDRMTYNRRLIIGIVLLMFVQGASATIYYVAKTGNDGNAGGESSPWLTIQKAANTAVAGDTVYVKAGTYTEQVIFQKSGTPGNYITFQNYSTDVVIATPPTKEYVRWDVNSYHPGHFEIIGKSFIKIKGFKFTGTPNGGGRIDCIPGVCYSPFTIVTERGSNNISIDGNIFYDIDRSAILSGYFPGTDNSKYYAQDISFVNNYIYRPTNWVYDELLSFDQTNRPNVSYNTLTRQGMGECIDYKQGTDNGIISYNTISNCYGPYGLAIPPLTWADKANRISQAIYLDAYVMGVNNNSVFNNIAWNTQGIVLGSEKGGLNQNNRIYNNIVYDSYHGIVLEPYITPGYPEPRFQNNTVINNVAYHNYANYKVGSSLTGFVNNVFRNNIGLDGQIMMYASTTQDHNSWDLGITDPKFVNALAKNFQLQSNSPAKDVGSSDRSPRTDFIGVSRPQANGYDIGAYELLSSKPINQSYDLNNDGTIDIEDLKIVSQNFNKIVLTPYPRYDVNMDGRVNILDSRLVSKNFP